MFPREERRKEEIKMKIVEKVKVTQKVFVANDGREFDNEYECKVYEQFAPQSVYDVVSKYVSFYDDEVVEAFKRNEIPQFAYLLVKERIPKEVIKYCDLITRYEENLPNIGVWQGNVPTLFYNDYSNAYNGSFADNGWKRIGNYHDIEEKIKQYENFKNMFLSVDK